MLILGTLPSKVSLQKQEYYGHPRNHFWPIIYALFSGELEDDYTEKAAFAKSHHLAIWDVCYTAKRPGSLDADIVAEVPNLIKQLLQNYPTIKTIAFNGKKSEQLYFKHFKREQGLTYITLLSTSPANAAFSFDKKLENWMQIMA